MQVFTLETGSSWTVSGDLPRETKQMVGASLGGVFYVMGGNLPGEYSSKVLSWNHDDKKWEEEGDMIDARSKHAISVVVFSDIANYCI